MNEFTLYRGKQYILAESLKELASMAESLGGKFDNYVQKDDISNVRKDLEDVRLGISELAAKVELQSEGSELPDHILDLQEEKEALEQILESNEEEFIEGKIKEDEYKKIKSTHIKKVEIVRLKLREELSKIRKEGMAAQIKTHEIARGIKAMKGTSEQDETSSDPSEQTESAPLIDSAPLAKQIPSASLQKPKNTPISKQKTPFQSISKNQPLEEEAESQLEPSEEPQEIDGELDDAKLEEAQELSISEEETNENEESLEDEEEASEPLLPKKSGKQQISKTAKQLQTKQASPLPSNQSKTILSKNAKPSLKTNSKTLENKQANPKAKPVIKPLQKKSVVKTSISSQLTKIAPPKTMQEKEGIMPSLPENDSVKGSRIYDIIKSSPEGKKVIINAIATTIKKNASQCLIKLEDDSGIIYGTFESPLKGQLALRGIIAKDASGVSYVKITSAK